ncbi:DegV family protein [Aceticella autotrophica]|uniref:DegV family protein n=1 Tax=Aceticella autotrophica TaxID=2755338 RepID=A0A975AUG4_9THEO|nr:DegV family protein [Aceticella autotrophica]QSZ26661.1 DegV family protein [Aceticella autotrophica]
MGKIAIVTDSLADVPEEFIKMYNIYVAPLVINIDGISYKDGVDLSKDDFYNLLNEGKMPTTSQVPPGEFIDMFEDLLKSYECIIAILLSSKLSGTYQSAVIAKNTLNNDKIFIIDSRNFSLGNGLIVIKAAEMALNGNSKDDIIKEVEDMIPKMRYIMTFDSLDYLYRGGRLNKSQAIIGNILNIKPIIMNDDGELKIVDKVRGRKNIIKWIIKYIRDKEIDFENQEIGLIHTGSSEFINDIENTLRSELGITKFIKSRAGCAAGVHAGPSAVGVFFKLK